MDCPINYPRQLVQQGTIAGVPVTLRPALPADIPLIVQYIEAMSPDERYLRHLGTVSSETLTDPKRLAHSYVKTLDYEHHMALVVVAADQSIIGVAHAYGPCEEEGGRYECSYSRRFDYRGQGVGTLLMEGILKWGQSAHLAGFWADTLRENKSMRDLFGSVGFTVVSPHPDGEHTLIRYRYYFSHREGSTP